MHRVAYIQIKKISRLHEYTLPFNKQVLVFPRIIVPIELFCNCIYSYLMTLKGDSLHIKLGYLQCRIAADILSICLLPIMVFYSLCRELFSKA